MKREAKRNRLLDVEVPGTLGAYIARGNKPSKFWGRLAVYTKDRRYDFTFMGNPKDSKKTERLARRLAASIRVLK